MGISKSVPNNITSPDGNSLAVFLDDNDSTLKLKDIYGNIDDLDNYIPPTPFTPTLRYGSFFSTQTQTSLGNEEKSMTFNNTDLSNGVSVVNNSQIKVTHAGVYNLQFSAQIRRTSGGGTSLMYIYFAKNGNNIPDSNTSITFRNNNDLLVAGWNFIVSLQANEFVEIKWLATVPEIEIPYLTGHPMGIPDIPSVIATLTQVG